MNCAFYCRRNLGWRWIVLYSNLQRVLKRTSNGVQHLWCCISSLHWFAIVVHYEYCRKEYSFLQYVHYEYCRSLRRILFSFFLQFATIFALNESAFQLNRLLIEVGINRSTMDCYFYCYLFHIRTKISLQWIRASIHVLWHWIVPTWALYQNIKRVKCCILPALAQIK